jgi:hypothetical protein
LKRKIMLRRLFYTCLLLVVVGAAASTALGQMCSRSPGYTYTTSSVDYDGEQVVVTGITSGAYSSCGHNFGVRVKITSPDGRQVTYQYIGDNSGSASGSAWIPFGGYDGEFFGETDHLEYCVIVASGLIIAQSQDRPVVEPFVRLVSLTWNPERIKRGESSNLVAVIYASPAASGLMINYHSDVTIGGSGSVEHITRTNPDQPMGTKTLALGDNSITPWNLLDSSAAPMSNDGTLNYLFGYEGPTTHNGKTVRYQGDRDKRAALTVKSVP